MCTLHTLTCLQVANKRNGIDVDKFDYLERDAMMCGVGVPLDAKRLMLFSRVSPDRQQVRWLMTAPLLCCVWAGAGMHVCMHSANGPTFNKHVSAP
jgi:HD superfamily phosphohydrolase